jgi:isopentenyl diphosphate isomerase/L-lactate dehydrogenase-like FMN-dependent dehydrogenase
MIITYLQVKNYLKKFLIIIEVEQMMKLLCKKFKKILNSFRKSNSDDFKKIKLIPRVLIDVSKISTKIKILGNEIDSPICIAGL